MRKKHPAPKAQYPFNGTHVFAGLGISALKGKRLLYVFAVGFDDFCVGEIRWCKPWKKYVFYPEDGAALAREALAEIMVFITQLGHREKNQ